MFEFDLRTLKKTELVSLYFCNEHYNHSLKETLKKLSEMCEKGKMIEKKVFDIGYVTY